jgi:hypothetical protein
VQQLEELGDGQPQPHPERLERHQDGRYMLAHLDDRVVLLFFLIIGFLRFIIIKRHTMFSVCGSAMQRLLGNG